MAESRNTPAASTSREASHAGEANTAATEGSEQNTTAGYIAGKRGFPLVSLDQVTDEKLRRVLAQQAPAAKAQVPSQRKLSVRYCRKPQRTWVSPRRR